MYTGQEMWQIETHTHRCTIYQSRVCKLQSFCAWKVWKYQSRRQGEAKLIESQVEVGFIIHDIFHFTFGESRTKIE